MNHTCKHCQRCFVHSQVANAYTQYQHTPTKVEFTSTDDDGTLGLENCQVCAMPTALMKVLELCKKTLLLLV